MKAVSLIALVAVMHISSALACSTDALRKIADERLERLPSGREHEFTPDDPPTESPGGTWQVFERENGTPHSILLVIRNELGQDKIRLSFLRRRDFVITVTAIGYPDLIQDGEQRNKFQIEKSEQYFFCNGRLQGQIDRAITALYWKKWIFETADELKSELQRVPE